VKQIVIALEHPEVTTKSTIPARRLTIDDGQSNAVRIMPEAPGISIEHYVAALTIIDQILFAAGIKIPL
jgi:hypothetical protein